MEGESGTPSQIPNARNERKKRKERSENESTVTIKIVLDNSIYFFYLETKVSKVVPSQGKGEAKIILDRTNVELFESSKSLLEPEVRSSSN